MTKNIIYFYKNYKNKFIKSKLKNPGKPSKLRTAILNRLQPKPKLNTWQKIKLIPPKIPLKLKFKKLKKGFLEDIISKNTNKIKHIK